MATLDDVRVLQKRARDKEYRIRKQGASQANIVQVSPRKNWSEVKGMTKQQLNAYARRLNSFNKNSRYVGSASGDVIPKKFLTQANKLIREHNKFVASEVKRIQGIAPELWEQYREKQRGILKNDGIGGLLTPIDVSKLAKPRSLDVAKRRVKSFEKRSRRTYNFYRKIQRKNMQAMMNQLGLYDLSDLVRSMTNEQFDVLSSVLPIWERLSPEYYAKGESAGTPQYDDVRAYVYKAYAVGSGKPDVDIYTKLDAGIKARSKRARKRALKGK